MAAPTSVRVEATSISTTVIRWSYSGSNQIGVWRSTDGVSYTELTVAPIARVAVGTTSYTDTELSTATKYWYKLSDDAGSTFSSVVTVWTHTCLDSPDGSDSFSLPRVTPSPPAPLTKREQKKQKRAERKAQRGGGELHLDPMENQVVSISETVEAMADGVNDMAKRVEEVLGARVLEPQQCAACPVDGALVINCASGCHEWVVIADEDINSISMQWCDNGVATVEFLIPPNTTRRICGFAGGFGFTGDECTQAPIVAGPNGRSVSVSTTPASGGKASPKNTGSAPGTNTGPGSGGGSGGGCNCVPNNGALTIKSCTANNSLGCSGQKFVNLVACGGRAPYTWTNTGSVTLSSTDRSATSVAPPANSGSAVAGTAYNRTLFILGFDAGTSLQFHSSAYGCNDNFIDGSVSSSCNCNSPGCTPAGYFPGTGLGAGDIKCDNAGGACNQTCQSQYTGGACCPGTEQAISALSAHSVDVRSGAMITAGCNPCGLQSGATVTVTDALGTQVTIILTA